jgi:hypothetical protein
MLSTEPGAGHLALGAARRGDEEMKRRWYLVLGALVGVAGSLLATRDILAGPATLSEAVTVCKADMIRLMPLVGVATPNGSPYNAWTRHRAWAGAWDDTIYNGGYICVGIELQSVGTSEDQASIGALVVTDARPLGKGINFYGRTVSPGKFTTPTHLRLWNNKGSIMESDLVNEHITATWVGPSKNGQGSFTVNGELWPIDSGP